MSETKIEPAKIYEALGFMRCTIKSGEPWTDHAEEYYNAGHTHLTRLEAANSELTARVGELEHALRLIQGYAGCVCSTIARDVLGGTK